MPSNSSPSQYPPSNHIPLHVNLNLVYTPNFNDMSTNVLSITTNDFVY
jgi:hypothetical protein